MNALLYPIVSYLTVNCTDVLGKQLQAGDEESVKICPFIRHYISKPLPVSATHKKPKTQGIPENFSSAVEDIFRGMHDILLAITLIQVCFPFQPVIIQSEINVCGASKLKEEDANSFSNNIIE